MALSAVLVGCGESDSSGPPFEVVPLACDDRIDRLEQSAEGWPTPASTDDLFVMNNDLLQVSNGLDDSCDSEVFDRLRQIECDYLTTVTGADPAAEAFLTSQKSRCEDDADVEPGPDDPAATVEDDNDATTTTTAP